MNCATTLLVCALFAGTQAADAADVAEMPVRIPTEQIQAPHLDPKHKPGSDFYPRDARQRGYEGWVQLDMMVDPDGKPFAVAVMKSTAPKELQDAAVSAVEHLTVVPGSVNGKPITAALQFQVVFQLTGQPRGVDEEFSYDDSRLLRAIHDKDKSAADSFMKRIEVRNFYDDSFYALTQYEYARVWGSKPEQLGALEQAIQDQHYKAVLPKDDWQKALFASLALKIDLHRYAEALSTWDELQKEGLDPRVAAKAAPTIEQIQRIRDNHLEYTVSGTISNESGWFLQLLEPQFRITVAKGHLSVIELRCQKGYVSFVFDPKLQYTVSGKYGTCGMELVGDPGTSFTLDQF